MIGHVMDAHLSEMLIKRFDGPDIDALVLMGSHARETATPYSDVDLTRFTAANGRQRTRVFQGLIADQLVVVNDLGADAVEEIFTHPEVAVGYLVGLRLGRPLQDRNGIFAHIQARAHAFTWDTTMQMNANAWASEALAGWSEDMRKGIVGLDNDHIGRLLQARFASSWGLSRIMQVQRGVLLTSDNDFYTAVAEAVGRDSEWVRLRHIAFGIAQVHGYPPTLREQVVAGLHLYIVTAELLAPMLRAEDHPLIMQTVELIRHTLDANGERSVM
jgi:predicted nucleotidyltransferase